MEFVNGSIKNLPVVCHGFLSVIVRYELNPSELTVTGASINTSHTSHLVPF